jgi:hypothetical protein
MAQIRQSDGYDDSDRRVREIDVLRELDEVTGRRRPQPPDGQATERSARVTRRSVDTTGDSVRTHGSPPK